ncbi:hypothetical protein HK098_002037 [Nowakowskiella sp. JEL0407]|nr:hypothetical protein HK098_002037 [Nowakowskiella sp. JEL0407]
MPFSTKIAILLALSVSALALPSEVGSYILGSDEILERDSIGLIKRQESGCANSNTGPPSGLPSVFPTATGSRSCSAPIKVSGVFDGGLRRYDRGAGYRPGDNCLNIEPGSADTIFLLDDGATLQNVIIGQEVADSVYCLGSCTLKNGVQHNGGGTAILTDIDVFYNGSGKLYRSCGGCGYPTRHVEMYNVRVHGQKGSALCGINADKGDTCKLRNVSIPAEWKKDFKICRKWPDETSDLDGVNCAFTESDITWTSGSGSSPVATKTSTKSSSSPTKPAQSSSPVKSPSPTKSPSSGGSGCVPLYGQCGGLYYTGSNCCASGSCKKMNDW